MVPCLASFLFSRVYVLHFIGIPLSVVVFGSIVCFVVFVFLLIVLCCFCLWFSVYRSLCSYFVVFSIQLCFSVVFLRVSVDILLRCMRLCFCVPVSH